MTSPKRSSQARERSPPGRRQRSRNSSVAIPAPRYSAITGPSVSSPMSTAAAPSPPAASSAEVASPPLVSNYDERRHAGRERRAQGSGARTQCATKVEGADFGTELQCGVDCGGVGLLEICRGGRGEPECLRLEVGGGQGATSGGDPHRGCVFVEGGHRALAATTSLAEERRDFGAVESVVRDVSPGGDDAPHDAPDAIPPGPAGSATRQQTTCGSHDLFAPVSGRPTAKATRASARLTS